MVMWLLASALLLAPFTAEAQVNRCVIDGQQTWQSAPCPPGTAEEGSEESDAGTYSPPPESPTRNQPPPPPKPLTKEEQCGSVASLAQTVMQRRQQGTSIRDMMSWIPDNTHEDGTSLAKRIIIDAYEEPRYSTNQYKQREITEFENRYFLICMKEFN